MEHSIYFIYYFRLVPTIIGFVLMSLAIHKAMIYWRELGINGLNLVSVIIKDQIFYYILYAHNYTIISCFP